VVAAAAAVVDERVDLEDVVRGPDVDFFLQERVVRTRLVLLVRLDAVVADPLAAVVDAVPLLAVVVVTTAQPLARRRSFKHPREQLTSFLLSECLEQRSMQPDQSRSVKHEGLAV